MKGTGVQTMTEIETTANQIESGMSMMIFAGIVGKEDARKAIPHSRGHGLLGVRG